MIGFHDLQYLSANSLIPPGARLLDIGCQNLVNLTLADARWFVERHGGIADDAAFRDKAVPLAYFATPRPGEETTYLADLLALTDIAYAAYDVAPGRRTTIFDLNTDSVAETERGCCDIVLNAGTTEHVINQLNAFRVMHDAMRVGGVVLHQVPSLGWATHGYVAYRPQFFRDLADANGYALMDMWYSMAGMDRLDPSVDIREATAPLSAGSGQGRHSPDCMNWNLNVLLRKDQDAPFRWGLELATSHAAADPSVLARYRR